MAQSTRVQGREDQLGLRFKNFKTIWGPDELTQDGRALLAHPPRPITVVRVQNHSKLPAHGSQNCGFPGCALSRKPPP